MKRFALLLVFALLLTGCAPAVSVPGEGLQVTVNAEDVFLVCYSTEHESGGAQNADSTLISPGSTLFFNDWQGVLSYTISVENKAGKTLASAQFTDDFSAGAVELTVTEDLEIIRN